MDTDFHPRVLVVAAALALIGTSAVGQDNHDYEPHPGADRTEAHLHFLNELGSRRRSNTLFRNEQAIDRGVQVSHVNVGAGNLTFARRDLVTVGRIPLVFARVYDSGATVQADFGPGWRIAAAEVVEMQGHRLLLRDESGYSVTFSASDADTFEPVLAEASPVQRISRRAADEFRAELQGGWTRTYRWTGGAFRLASVRDATGNSVELTYAGGLLQRISAASGRFIQVYRRGDGRIMTIADDAGRGVRYRYDDRGRLIAAYDLGGDEWRYGYDHKDRLVSVISPELFEELTARYDLTGRVRQVFANGVQRTFSYTGPRTEVRDIAMGTASFLQDRNGITIKVKNFAGGTTQLDLNRDANVVQLSDHQGAQARFKYRQGLLRTSEIRADEGWRHIDYSYTADGKLTSISGNLSTADAIETTQLQYDTTGALISSSNGMQARRYQFSERGDLESFIENDEAYTFQWNEEGQVTASEEGRANRVGFQYRPDGKLLRTDYWDGRSINYEHDALGTRSFADWGDQGNVIYTYNRAGSARELLIQSPVRPGGHTIELDRQQRVKSVTYRNGASFSVDYDAVSNPQRVTSSAGDVTQYEYDDSNRLQRIVTNGVEAVRHDYAPAEMDLRTRTDHKTMRTLVPARRAPLVFGTAFDILYTRAQGTPYGTVVFDEELLAFHPVSTMGVVLEDAVRRDGLARMRLIDLKRDGFSGKEKFEQPSNILFLPAEYLAINCCIPCDEAPFPELCPYCPFPEGYPEAPLCYCAPEPTPPPGCSIPVDFQQYDVFDLGGGNLGFEYRWISSSGNLDDLAQCEIGESVTYPGATSLFPRPYPFPPGNHANPTEIEVTAESGAIGDTHFVPPGNFLKPYTTASYTGTQIYRYRCPCMNNGNWIQVFGPLPITREVFQNGNGTWRYRVTKPIAGLAEINPLPP